MSIYKESDIELLQKNWPKIIDDIEDFKNLNMEPTLKEQLEIVEIIKEYVIKNKRKIYGGYAQHLLIKDKNPDDQIYPDGKLADIDFYSPHPVEDIMNICNILYEKKYKHIAAEEAQHTETFKLRVYRVVYCDISYVPKHIYQNIPFIEIDKMIVCNPSWLLIDSFRMMNDPIISYWRFDDNNMKKFRRIYKILKYYPFTYKSSELDPKKIYECFPIVKDREDCLNVIYDFLKNRNTTILLGHYAYDFFVKESEFEGLQLIKVPYFNFISTDYKKDFFALISLLNEHIKKNDLMGELEYVEYYPFFQFTDYNVKIYYTLKGKQYLIARIYNNNKKCIPYQDITPYNFHQDKIVKDKKDFIRLCTFPYLLMQTLIDMMELRKDGEKVYQNSLYVVIANLLTIRKFYFEKNKINIVDKSIFQEFITTCIGVTMDPEKILMIVRKERKEKGLPLVWRYTPEDGVREPVRGRFYNTSGNMIREDKNKKLLKKDINDEEEIGSMDEDDSP